VTNYRRNFICGGSFLFTANLAERRLRLPVDDIVSAKDDGFRCRSTHPYRAAKATRPVKKIYQFFQMLNTMAWRQSAARPVRRPHARVNAS
jgi:hypothetical protein